MDFCSRLADRNHNLMMEGDLVIIYERHDSLDYLFLAKGQILNNRHGVFYHDDFINMPFGSKINSKVCIGWLYALKPTPELWTLAVHTRTQIVDEVDAAMVTSRLGIRPGHVVVESGTGSGCMSLSFARAIYPHGHLNTFEYNPVRAKEASEEFVRLGVADVVTVRCHDVCGKSGEGGFIGVAQHSVDAIFLDLPEPWLAIPHVLNVLKPGKSLCSYSPCMGQVEKTCEALRNAGFHSVTMIEIRRRPYDGRTASLEIPKMRPDTLALSEDINSIDNQQQGNSLDDEQNRKKARVESPIATNSSNGEPLSELEVKNEATKMIDGSSHKKPKWTPPVGMERRSVLVARPLAEMKGHTAFLTFAVRPSNEIIAVIGGE